MPSSSLRYLIAERHEVVRVNRRIEHNGYVETDATTISMLVKERDGGAERERRKQELYTRLSRHTRASIKMHNTKRCSSWKAH